MPTMPVPRRDATPGAAAPRSTQASRCFERDAQFTELLNGYSSSGGLARVTESMACLRQRGEANMATVARWIVKHEVVYFEWETETWLPVFQFGAADMHPHATVRRAILELAPLMQPWEVAQWFARPNVELAGRRPADMLAEDPEALWQAARTDRYLIDA